MLKFNFSCLVFIGVKVPLLCREGEKNPFLSSGFSSRLFYYATRSIFRIEKESSMMNSHLPKFLVDLPANWNCNSLFGFGFNEFSHRGYRQVLNSEQQLLGLKRNSTGFMNTWQCSRHVAYNIAFESDCSCRGSQKKYRVVIPSGHYEFKRAF